MTTNSLSPEQSAHLDIPSEPHSLSEVMETTAWREAMSHELEALMQNNTWELVSPEVQRKVISNKWVFKVKTKSRWNT